MAKVKIKVVGAYVDGHAPGSEIEIEEKSAKHLVEVGYAEVLKAVAPKTKPARKRAPAKKAADKED